MSDTPTVHTAVGRVLAALPAIGKNQRNAQQGFNFRGIDDVLNALNPLLSEHGVIIVPHRVIERTAGQRTTAKGGVMYEVGLHVQYRIYGPAGDYIEAEAWGEGTDSGDKATPKAMTGAYKYMLFEAFSISTEEASKTDADRHSPEPAMRLIDCPEACGHQAPKDDLRGHLLDRHGWTRHGDGRVTRPKPSPASSPAAGAGDGVERVSSPVPSSPHGGAGGGNAAAAGAPPMSDPQRRRLMALCNERGLGDRDARLDFATTHLGRDVGSFGELSKDDAAALMEALDRAPVAPSLLEGV